MKPPVRTYGVYFLLLLVCWASSCKPVLEYGKVTYEVLPGVTEPFIPQQADKPKIREVFFDDTHIVETPEKKGDWNLLRLLKYSFHNWKSGVRYQVREAYGATFLVEMNDSHSRNYQLIPIEGKKKIAGYRCKGAKIITPLDTAIIWYTPKLKVNYSPWLLSIPQGFVLQMEEAVQLATISFEGEEVPGRLKKLNLKMLMEGEDRSPFPSDSSAKKEWATRITKAISIEKIPFDEKLPFDDDNIKRIKEDDLKTLGFLDGSYSLEQLDPGSTLVGKELLINEVGPSDRLELFYAFTSYEEKITADLKLLERLRAKYTEELLGITIISEDAYGGDSPFPQLSGKGEWLKNTGLFTFPSFVLLDSKGNVIESVFSYLDGAEEILESLINNARNVQTPLTKE